MRRECLPDCSEGDRRGQWRRRRLKNIMKWRIPWIAMSHLGIAHIWRFGADPAANALSATHPQR